jgi:hypothetical protein
LSKIEPAAAILTELEKVPGFFKTENYLAYQRIHIFGAEIHVKAFAKPSGNNSHTIRYSILSILN